MSEKPVSTASLAQVYKAVLRYSGREVAVKAQRPDVRATVSNDLYILRRAVNVYKEVMDHFAQMSGWSGSILSSTLRMNQGTNRR